MITIYDDVTGRLKFTMHSQVLSFLDSVEDPYVDGVYNGEEYYMDLVSDELTLRPDSPIIIDKTAVLVNELVTLSNIPNPSTVTVQGLGSFEVNAGIFEIDFDLPDTYTLQINSFPFKDAEFTITCE